MPRRLYQLAQELQVDSKILLERFHTESIFHASASSMVGDAEAAMARSWFPHDGERNPFGQPRPPLVPPKRIRPRTDTSTSQRWRGGISPMTQLMLDRKVLPRRTFSNRGGPWTDEVRMARVLAQSWGECWFTLKQVKAWLDQHPHIQPCVAADLQRNGLTPEEAATRLWYGKVNNGRPDLAERVGCGEITAERAAAELASHRRSLGKTA